MNNKWFLKELKDIKKNNLNVFSCFSAGGGSSLGYKLAGYNVLGGVEIDSKMMNLYKKNIKSQFTYLMGVEDFNKISNKKLPQELFNLDILDGSPPCSSFSISGKREETWGIKKKFNEGQVAQYLDDLFFKFIDTVRKLQPKIVIAENVEGLLLGKAQGFVKLILERFKKEGYDCQIFLINAIDCNVPQTRKRVFFIANNQKFKPLILKLIHKANILGEALKDISNKNAKLLNKDSLVYSLWNQTLPGYSFSKYHIKGNFFNSSKLSPYRYSPTITASAGAKFCHWDSPRLLSKDEMCIIQSFPLDYDFENVSFQYVLGMSVPPFMLKSLSELIYKQWYNK